MRVEDVVIAVGWRPYPRTLFVVDLWTHTSDAPDAAWALGRFALTDCDAGEAVAWAKERETERRRAIVFATAGLDSEPESWLWLYGRNPNGYDELVIGLRKVEDGEP